VTTTPDELLRAYEAALGTQDWNEVEPLMHEDVCVTFSDGATFKGRAQVQRAFTRNFSLIQDERYEISSVHWITKAGRGTSLMANDGGEWLVLAEHLGPLAE
jgi:hypothetical protein